MSQIDRPLHEVAIHMAQAFPNNELARKAFIRELKHIPGGLDALINEMFGHKECYSGIVNAMSSPESRIPRRLAFAMNECHLNWLNELMGMPNDPFKEAVSPPISKILDDTDEDDEDDADLSGEAPVPPEDAPPDAMGDMSNMGGDMSGAPMGDMGMGGGMPPPPMGGGGIGMPMGGMGGMPTDPNTDPNMQDPNAQVDPNVPMDPNAPMDPNNPDMQDPNAQVDPNANGQMPDPKMQQSTEKPMFGLNNTNKPNQPTKKEFAYHHLTREMSKYEPMKGFMKEILGG